MSKGVNIHPSSGGQYSRVVDTANSGQTVNRYRLNRSGNRQLNWALHTIVLSRARHDPATRAYIERRTAEGKTPREIRRCLKRYLTRQLYRLLNQHLSQPEKTALTTPETPAQAA